MTDQEWLLTSGDYRAVVTAVGASLRLLTHRGRDLVVPFGAGQVRPRYCGALVAPWPNRLAGGQYRLRGNDYQLPINEVGRANALHGLVLWVRFEAVEVAADRVVLQHDLVPQDGYPFPLRLVVEFRLDPAGLHTTLTATNTGPEAAPYGCCPHPYLVAGAGPLDSWQLTMPAASRLEVDDRLLPLDLVPVGDVDCDFRAGAVIGGREIDHAFTDLAEPAGYEVRVVDPADGTGVTMTWGDWAPWLQIHTADRPEPEFDRIGLAVEPMSCPPDAFNLGDAAPLLAAGATHEAQWSISATATSRR